MGHYGEVGQNRYKVGPQTIAKLVNITPKTMVYDTNITINKTWGESKPT